MIRRERGPRRTGGQALAETLKVGAEEVLRDEKMTRGTIGPELRRQP